MHKPNCSLTILFPRALEEQIVDFMLTHDRMTAGFVSTPINGHGANAIYASAGEKVRGTARQMMLTAILSEDDATTLLADLKSELPQANIVYWLTPLIAFGSFV